MEPRPSPITAHRLRTLLPWLGAVAGFFLAVFIFAMTVEFIQPALPRIHIDSVNVYDTTISTQQTVTANWDVTFSSANPNNSPIVYDRLNATAMQRKKPIATANSTVSLAGHDYDEEAVFLVSFSNMAVGNLEVVNDDGVKGKDTVGSVRFSVRLVGEAIYRGPTWPRKRIAIEGSCGEVEVKLCSNRSSTVVFGKRICRVDGYWRSVARAFRLVKIVAIVITFGASFTVIYVLGVLNAGLLSFII